MNSARSARITDWTLSRQDLPSRSARYHLVLKQHSGQALDALRLSLHHGIRRLCTHFVATRLGGWTSCSGATQLSDRGSLSLRFVHRFAKRSSETVRVLPLGEGLLPPVFEVVVPSDHLQQPSIAVEDSPESRNEIGRELSRLPRGEPDSESPKRFLELREPLLQIRGGLPPSLGVKLKPRRSG